MKKFLGILAMMMTVLCSSIVLSACSDGYKKMYLEVEYALPKEGGGGDWHKVRSAGSFDYILEEEMKADAAYPNLYVMYLRVNVKGVSKKKVDSLYISSSETSSIVLPSNVIKPNETFKVYVSTTGSATFKVTPPPNKGGEDKSISFTVNIYKSLESINQNTSCVPAIMVGDTLKIDALTNLIDYHPIGQTNQKGVDYKISGVGRFSGSGLLEGDFITDDEFKTAVKTDGGYELADAGDLVIYNGAKMAELVTTPMGLLLNASAAYALNADCNIIQLEASSIHKPERKTFVYIYVVEKFSSNSWTITYSEEDDNIDLPNSPVGEIITIYNSKTNDETSYDSVEVYTHLKPSIYSWQSSPGMDLIVKVNGERYEYKGEFPNNRFGIKITEVSDNPGALKFSVYPDGESQTNIYNVEVSVDFTDFDFSASTSKPAEQLKKKFIINVESLPSAFNINTKSSTHNIDDFNNDKTPYVVNYNDPTEIAELYTSYVQSLGMPLDLKVVPTDVADSTVNVKFYKELIIKDGDVDVAESEELGGDILRLRRNSSSIVDYYLSTGFVVDGKDMLYLSFYPSANIQGLEDIYMVSRATCTPVNFGGVAVEKEDIVNISKVKVVGAVDSINLYKDTNGVEEFDDTYVATNLGCQTAYIKFESNAQIAYDNITISSKDRKIKYSYDMINWADSITANQLRIPSGYAGNDYREIYFKVVNQCTDTMIISSPNGYTFTRKYQFVSVTSGADNVKVKFDNTYITQFDASDNSGVVGTGVDKVSFDMDAKYGTNVDLIYLAMQAGSTVQFMAYGDGDASNIAAVNATKLTFSMDEYLAIKDAAGNSIYASQISKFSSTAIALKDLQSTFFDVKANSVGYTSILLVKVDYYVVEDREICLASKYFVYEIATYTPASGLSVANKDSILYINNDYLESATVDFNIAWSVATKELSFSSAIVNQKINSRKDGVTSSIYAIKAVSPDITAQNASYFKIEGLNGEYVSLNSKRFTLYALKSLTNLEEDGQYSVSFNIIIEQFGQETTYSITKVIAFGQYEKAQNIIIGGADSYYNLYMSLTGESVTSSVTAKVSNTNATHKEVGYQILSVNKGLNTKEIYTGENLKIEAVAGSDQFNITASNFGGIYEVVFYSKDSYNSNLKDKDGNPALVKYEVQRSIIVNVLDGRTDETAFLINNMTDFLALAQRSGTGHKYYRLSNDIDLSSLNHDNWWKEDRVFDDTTLDGASTIYNPNTGVTIQKSYRIVGVRISSYKGVDGNNTFALFTSITSSAIIKNVIFNEVVYDVVLNEGNTGANVAIGAIAGVNKGTIENCSVSFKEIGYRQNSHITLSDTAQNKTYNIGLMVGINEGSVKHNNTEINTDYCYMLDVEDGAKLDIIINEGNSNLNTTSNINIGGVAGQNVGTISATYEDNSDQAIRTLITAVVNMEFTSNYSSSNPPVAANIAFGGIVGLNDGTIKNVAVSGSLMANDKVNMGGIAGENTGKIQEVANYGACVEGCVLIEGYEYKYVSTEDPKSHVYHSFDPTSTTTVNLEQNIGGIVGFNNKGAVDNVRTMFITFENTEVSIMPLSSYIMGVGNVGGIMGKAINTQLTRAYVENFISDINSSNNKDELIKSNFNIIGNNAVVGGLIACVADEGAAADATRITLAFVQADFKVDGCTFNEFGPTGKTYSYVYCIGDVCGVAVGVSGLLANAYIVRNIVEISEDDGIYTLSDGTVTNTNIPSDLTSTSGTVVIGGVTYYIGWRKTTDVNKFEGVDYPYLIYKLNSTDSDDKAIKTLTVVPDEIIVKVDNKYFGIYKQLTAEPVDWATNWTNYYKLEDGIYSKLDDATAPTFEIGKHFYMVTAGIPSFEKWEEGLYIQYVDDSNSHGLSATAIVYYYSGADNIHKLVTNGDGVGLIEKSILPSIASGVYSVSIASGSDKAALVGSDSIKFKEPGTVVLKFVSAFNRDIQDTVTIFVENPISEDVFDVVAGAGLQDINNNGEEFSTSVGRNPELSTELQNIDGLLFNSENLYMTCNIDGVVYNRTNPIDESDYRKYFSFAALTKEIVGGSGKYSLGAWQLTTKDLDDAISEVKLTLKINIYLDLTKYSIDMEDPTSQTGFTARNLYQLTGIDNALLNSKQVVIKIFNKATDLSVDSNNITAESGAGVTITAKLTTGYVGSINNGAGIPSYSDERLSIVTSGNVPLEQDTLYYALTPENQNALDLVAKAKADYNLNKSAGDPEFSIWNIFDDVSVNYVKDSLYGYDYVLSFNLKEEYRYLDVSKHGDKEWKFKLAITASTNASLVKEVIVTFVPQQLLTFRLENYSNLVAREGAAAGTTESEFVSNEVESSLIIPGESGLVKIFAEHSYSYFDNITISSTKEVINGKEYFVRFQQMVYDRNRHMYVSYAGTTSEGNILNLSPVSYFEDGKYVYDGVIFVRTILENIVGVRKVFTFTVDAQTYNSQTGEFINIACEKTVISQYRPGVYVSVTGAIESSDNGKVVYMIEENSTTTQIISRVYGYEFNISPRVDVKGIGGASLSSSQVVCQMESATKDESGAYILVYNLKAYSGCPAFEIELNMELVDGANTLTSTSEKLTFYPVEYVIKDMHLAGESNGSFNINVSTSRDIDLVWTTQTGTSKSNAINLNINNSLGNEYLKLFTFVTRDPVTMLPVEKDFSQFVNDTNNAFSIKKNIINDKYRIEALEKQDPILVQFNIYYGYTHTVDAYGDVNSTIHFSKTQTTECPTLFTHQFYLSLLEHSTEDLPLPVETQADLEAMAQDENYILTKDIVVRNWSPLTTAIGSLDGNGYVIRIESFDVTVTASMNVGLFAATGQNTILKNVVVDISQLEQDDDVMYIRDDNVTGAVINFGIIAGVNNGLIYNCEVISLKAEKELTVEIGPSYRMVFGGLVGVNNGNITNSRVGTEYFERLTPIALNNNEVSVTKLTCYPISFTSKGIMAGLVGTNGAGCVISSSYVANTSITNILPNGNSDKNRTAGFVVNNSGTIAYSYVKGLETSITATNVRASGCKVYSQTGSVAGFVYKNSGTINDCYSNIECESASAGVAGFAYDTTGGAIKQCYTASDVTSYGGVGLATQLPFIGVGLDFDNAGKLLSSANVENCYYLDDGSKSYDKNYTMEAGAIAPKGLGLSSFSNVGNLNNYSFVISGSNEQQLNGVWTYSTAIDPNKSAYILGITSLPELTSANFIARSMRIARYDDAGNVKEYMAANGYHAGSIKNPYIIRSVEEYTQVFVGKDASIRELTGSVRFIDNIDFKLAENLYEDVATRSNYVLGDKSNRTISNIDGNGMTISNLVINYDKDDTGSLGLFSEAYYATIKALNIGFASVESGDDSGDTKALYAGGVVGFAKDVYFIDINLYGQIIIRANNIAGGLVGQLTGNSGIYNVSSDLHVSSGFINKKLDASGSARLVKYHDNIKAYSTKQTSLENFELSYAGGLAGILDIININDKYENVNKITISSSNIEAEHAGGVAGFMGADAYAKRLNYIIAANSSIIGSGVAGGIVAENYANIELSQINGATIDSQYNYDAAFADYINNASMAALDTESSAYGNLSAIQGDRTVGGFVGINYGGDIKNSLTKANIGPHSTYGIASTIGGFAGISYGGNYQYVYAQNYVDMTYDIVDSKGNFYAHSRAENVGGFAGKILKDIALSPKSDKIGFDNVVVNTFFDKSEVIKEVVDGTYCTNAEHEENPHAVGKINTDYLVAEWAGTDDVRVCLKTDTTGGSIIRYGNYNYQETESDKENDDETEEDSRIDYNGELYAIGKTNAKAIIETQEKKDFDIHTLYNAKVSKKLFEEMFLTWPFEIWESDYTKFLPNLKTDNATDYIKLYTKEDLKYFEMFPDRNFILMQDINIDSVDGNYVVPVDFSGTLISNLDNDEYAKFKNIRLNAAASNGNNAGFFKSLQGARITNIEFVYSNLRIGGAMELVGGIAPISSGENTRLENVVVKGQVTTRDGGSVKGLGSLIGSAGRVTIVSCSSSMVYNVTSNQGNIGGLIGLVNGEHTVKRKVIENGVETIKEGTVTDALIRTSSYTGTMNVLAPSGTTVGGLVGSATYADISANTVAKVEDQKFENINITLGSKDASTTVFGGIVGVMETECQVDSSATYLNITSHNSAEYDKGTLYIGGIAGQMDMDTASEERFDIKDSYSKLTTIYTDADNTTYLNKANNLIIGGIVAYNESNGAWVENVASDIVFDSQSTAEYINCITLGGIVGQTKSAGTTRIFADGSSSVVSGITIKNAVSIMESAVYYDEVLLGGGIIGQASRSETSYEILNSASIGYIHANFTKADKTGLTILGGFIGLAGSHGATTLNSEVLSAQIIKNSYTVLTLSTAGAYKEHNGNQYNVYTNSIVGYMQEGNTVTAENVLYSSDYTLTLDEYASENNEAANTGIQNVTAYLLINNESYLQTNNPSVSLDVKLVGDWLSFNGGLPIPNKTQNFLVSLGVLSQSATSINGLKYNNEGKSYNPIIHDGLDVSKINGTNGNGTTEYKYHVLTKDVEITVTAASISTLNGVILGSNFEVENAKGFVETISAHSAISNIKFTVVDNMDNVIAVTNNGTIFMCGVYYNQLEVQTLVGENNGTMAYCYNAGNSIIEGYGLVGTNSEKATIEYSYFTGSFYKDKELTGSALANSDEGYIGNSYSAGQASKLISTANGRYYNVKYDYYANYIKESDYATLNEMGIAGFSTEELQTVSSDEGAIKHQTYDDLYVESAAFGKHWAVYGMHNLSWLGSVETMATPMTYNYGYPIHNIRQYKLSKTGVHLIAQQGIATGNGTFNPISEDTTPNGTLVNHSYMADNGTGDVPMEMLYDDCAYQISNIGVLYQINKINSWVSDYKGSQGKYFELVADIQLPSDVADGDVVDGSKVKYKEDSNELLSVWPGLSSFSGTLSSTIMAAAKDDDGNYVLDTTNPQETITQTEEDTEDDECTTSFEDLTRVVAGFVGETEDEDTRKTITYLRGEALVETALEGAVITNIVVQNSFVNNATLIGNVKDEESSLFGVTIYNAGVRIATLGGASGSITAIEENAYGLIGSVETDAILNLHTVEYADIIFAEATKIAGVVGTNKGAINIKNSFNEFTDYTFSFQDSTKEVNVAGFVFLNEGQINCYSQMIMDIIVEAKISNFSGFVDSNGSEDCGDATIAVLIELSSTLTNVLDSAEGTFSGFARKNYGDINGAPFSEDEEVVTFTASPAVDDTSKITNTVNKIATLAGMVGTMEEGVIDGFNINFGNIQEVDRFGGVVATLKGGEIGDDEGNGITVSLPSEISIVKSFGGIVCISNSDDGTGSINDVDITLNDVTLNKDGDIDDSIAYGVVIGTCENIQSISYTISSESNFIVYGKNVGGIVGVSKCLDYKFDCERPAIVNVYGLGNVGGFAGIHGTGGDNLLSIKMKGAEDEDETNWITNSDTDPYARIEWINSETETTYSNYGGFIGFWYSNATLKEVTNINPIFEKTLDGTAVKDPDSEASIISPESDIKITNVGGIVGKSTGGLEICENLAQVGIGELSENPNDGNNVIYGTNNVTDTSNTGSINQLPNISYIGGLVGLVESDKEITLAECLSKSNVYGVEAVGGLIGGSADDLTINGFNKAEVSGNVGGLLSIGGVVGYVKGNLKFSAKYVDSPDEPDAADPVDPEPGVADPMPVDADGGAATPDEDFDITFNSIYGAVNVGGIVGRVSGKGIINLAEQELTFRAIMGNANVGSVVGYLGETSGHQISSVNIPKPDETDTSEDAKLNRIYGTVFDYYIDDPDGDANDGIYYYHPVNIGGIVGVADGSIKFTDNITHAVVLTDSTYKTLNGEYQVSTLNNYVAKYATYPTEYTSWSSGIYTQDSDRYSEETGGVGGFAGLVNTIDEMTDCAVYGDVYAPYGVNVGGAYGYTTAPTSDNGILLPKLGGEDNGNDMCINVAGKIFTGAVIGKVAGWAGDISDDMHVKVQQYNKAYQTVPDAAVEPLAGYEILQGHCVGGVFGYSTARVTGISLDSSCGIKVFNSTGHNFETQYVGAIVGRLDASPIVSDDDDPDNGDFAGCVVGQNVQIIQSKSVYNYGGLAGLLYIDDNVQNVTVRGTHYYPFTIDTIHSTQFANGATKYEYNQTENMLIAFAHYINSANISIIASSDEALYDSPKGDATDDYNPILGKDYKGWAPEYTMFRNLSRLIKQNNAPTGDSVQTVYSANYILHVQRCEATITDTLKEDTDPTKVTTETEIVYTIYQPLNQKARLYCKYGIAELMPGFDIGNINASVDGKFFYDAHYLIKLDAYTNEEQGYEYSYTEWMADWTSRKDNCMDTDNDGEKNCDHDLNVSYNMDDIGSYDIEKKVGRSAFFTHVYDISFIKSEYLDSDKKGYFNGNAINGNFDDDLSAMNAGAGGAQYTFGYTYYVPTSGICKDKYMVFTSVFGNLEYSVTQDGETKKYSENTALYSNSGSLFEVTGTCQQAQFILKDNEAWVWWALGALVAIGVIALVVATGGLGGFAAMAALTGAKAVIAWSFFGIVMTALSAVYYGCIIGALNVGFAMSENLYSRMQNASQGYMYNTYTREISWTDGKLDVFYDGQMMLAVDATFKEGTLGDLNNETFKKDPNPFDEGSTYDYECQEMFGGTRDKPLKNVNLKNATSCKLGLMYFEYSATGNQIDDLNATIELNESDLGTIGYLDIFNALGYNRQNKVSIPKYVQSDDRIYICSAGAKTSYEVYPNYELYVSGRLATAKPEEVDNVRAELNKYYANIGGYAYKLRTEKYDDPLVFPQNSEVGGAEINGETAGTINTVVQADVSGLSITNNGKSPLYEYVGVVRQEDAIWKATTDVDNSKPEDGLYYKLELYESEDEPTGGYYININGTYYGTKETPTKTEVAFEPHKDGNITTMKLRWLMKSKEASVPPDLEYTLYYVLDSGNTDPNKKFTAKGTYVFVGPNDRWGQAANNGNGSIGWKAGEVIQPFENGQEIGLYLYHYDKDKDEWTKSNKLPISKIYDEWETYKNHYLQEGALYPISYYYFPTTTGKGGNIKTLQEKITIRDMVFKDGVYYKIKLDQQSVAPNFDGRHVYANGKYKLYTRYCYGPKHISHSLDVKLDCIDNTSFNKTVVELLYPQNGASSMNTGILFAENVRVTLSIADGVTIYSNYPTSISVTGKIKVKVPENNS